MAYTCKFCGKSFINGKSLGGHLRQKHLAELKQAPATGPAPAGPASKPPLPEAQLPTPVATGPVQAGVNPNPTFIPLQNPPVYWPPTVAPINPNPMNPQNHIQPVQGNQWGPVLQFLGQLLEKGGKKEPDPMSQLAYQFFQKLVERQVDRIVSNLDMLEQYRAKGAAEAEKEVIKKATKEVLEQQIKQPRKRKEHREKEENVSREIITIGQPAH